MDVSYSIQGSVIIIELSGLFEYPDEPRMMKYIRNRLTDRPSTIALNMTGVDSINSAGVAALLSILKLADENKIEFIIYGTNQKVQHVLEKVFSQDMVPLLTEEEFQVKYL